MDIKTVIKKNGKKELYYKAQCPVCFKDRGHVRKSRVNQLCQACSGRKTGLGNKGKIGPNLGKKFSEITKNKMSAVKQGLSPWNKGKKETRQEVLFKISAAKTGKTAHNKGRPLTLEQRIKLSCAEQKIAETDFKGFLQPQNKRQRDTFYSQKIHTLCFERDNWTCRSCNKRGGKLNAHHANSWKHFPEQRLLLDNVVTLCRTCHELFHRTYGNGKHKPNTREQFDAFLTKRLREVYVITGAPGAGKSWVLSRLNNFDVIDTDSVRVDQWRKTIDSVNKPIISITVKVSTFIKNNPDLSFKLVVIDEPLEVLEQRVLLRGGTITPTLKKRRNRMKSLAKGAVFSGTSEQVLAFLSAIK